MKNILLPLFSLLLIFVNCKKEQIDEPASNIIDITNLASNAQGLENQIGVYAGWYQKANRQVRFHGVFEPNYTSSKHELKLPWLYAGCFEDISDSKVSNCGKFMANEIEMIYNEEHGKYETLLPHSEIESFFNQVIGRDLILSHEPLSGDVVSRKFKLSQAIKITNIFEKRIGNTGMAEFDRDNWVMNYNYDPDSKNGLLVKISYKGWNVNSSLDDIQNGTSENLSRIVYFENEFPDGKIRLPSELFDAIPDGGVLEVWVHRNNGEIFTVNDKKYSFDASFAYQFTAALK